MIDFEKQIVFRANRLMRVRKVRCLRSIFCVCCLPMAWVFQTQMPLIHAGMIGVKS